MNNLTPEEQAILARLDAATPGPYETRCREFSNHAPTDIRTLLRKINELRGELSELKTHLELTNEGWTHEFKLKEENEKLRLRNEKLVAALGSYASKELWQHQPCPDLGYEAREALKENR